MSGPCKRPWQASRRVCSRPGTTWSSPALRTCPSPRTQRSSTRSARPSRPRRGHPASRGIAPAALRALAPSSLPEGSGRAAGRAATGGPARDPSTDPRGEARLDGRASLPRRGHARGVTRARAPPVTPRPVVRTGPPSCRSARRCGRAAWGRREVHHRHLDAVLLQQGLLQRMPGNPRTGGIAPAKSGSGTEAIEPSICSGAGASTRRASHKSRWPRVARAWFRSISSGQPPGRSAPRNRRACGTQRNGVGSSVPLQSNSSRNRGRSVRAEFAPWLMTSGRSPCWRSRRT